MVRTILRLPAVREATGLACSTIYAKIARGEFPAPVQISGNRVGWFADEVAAWQDGLLSTKSAAR